MTVSEEELAPLEGELAALVDAERGRYTIPETAQARLAGRLAASGLTFLLPPSSPATSASPSPAPASPSWRRAIADAVRRRPGRAVVAAFVAGAIAGGALHAWLGPRARSEAPAEVAAPLPAIRAPAGGDSAITAPPSTVDSPRPARATSAPAPKPSTDRARSRDHAPAPATSTPPDRDGALAAERTLIETARSAMARGEAGDALAALERHAQAFPAGRLSEEREALAIEALSTLGHRKDARRRAEKFHRDFPRSLLAPVVDDATQSIP